MGEGKGWEAHISISTKPVNPAGEYIGKVGEGQRTETIDITAHNFTRVKLSSLNSSTCSHVFGLHLSLYVVCRPLVW